MDTEEHRIVDFIVNIERRLDASRFSVDRARAFARRQHIAAGFIELGDPDCAPRIILDQPRAEVSEELKQCIRVRWIAMQRSLRDQVRQSVARRGDPA